MKYVLVKYCKYFLLTEYSGERVQRGRFKDLGSRFYSEFCSSQFLSHLSFRAVLFDPKLQPNY